MDPSHVDVVRHKGSGDVTLVLGSGTTAALAVLLHLVDDNPNSKLSPHLVPLMRALDDKLIGYRTQAG